MSSMKSLAARLLGEFSIDGVDSAALGSRKARLALHLLALAEGQPVQADVLADALWADTPPARPGDQLAVLMSRLRSVLGRERIEHTAGGYLLHADWQDTIELRHLTDEIDRRQQGGNVMGAAAAARVALGLLRDPAQALLTGEWAQLRRAAIERLAGRARLTAAAALLEAGDWMAAADAAAAAIERDPYDESALRLVLRAYAAGGQPSAALAAYGRTRDRLAEDLGADPSPQTAALFTAILRGELPSAAPAAAAPVLLAGRGKEVAFLNARAGQRDGGTQVIVIDGEPGIGKTSLLRAWASQRAAAGDTVLLASCGKLDRSMPLDAVLTALAGLLRRQDDSHAAGLLGQDAALLGPLLGVSSWPRSLPVLADSMLGPAVLYGALTSVLGRLGAQAPVVVLIDDAHVAGPALRDWIEFLQRENLPLVVVAAVRSGTGEQLPGAVMVHLDVLDEAAAAEIVGRGRVGALYEKSRGNPLFLTELAQQPAGSALPASLVDSVSARCDELGRPAALLRTAAVIGPDLDLDLIAAVLGRPMLELLDDGEMAVRQQFLAEDNGQLRFRHELVRDALAASASAGRAALLHRQAGRVLARRPAADPLIVAEHARLGGDLTLAASALRDAAGRTAERFDHAAAEALLDDAIGLHPEADSWLERARVRIRRGRYAEALEDIRRSGRADAGALEVSAWASYFDRRFAPAAQYAEEGAIAAADAVTRARCLAVAGRIWHAAGDLGRAETRLGEAMALAEGTDRVTAAAWLGVLRAHQGRPADALPLLRPAARGQTGAEHTSATMHALLFTGHAHAIAGAPERALAAFARHTAEVERRHVPRFAGRGVNFAGWVLRNLGATTAALDCHAEALEAARALGTPEVEIAVLQDLAELRLDAGDADGADPLLAQAQERLTGDLVFGWRLGLKHHLISARMALLRGEPELALATADRLAEAAGPIGVSRYASGAGILRHRARAALGQPADRPAAERDLRLLEQSVAVEAWWWTGELAADLKVPAWLDRAAEQADRLAAAAGNHGDTLRRHANLRLARWRRAIG
jgi:DNA-binding SARP family transcriptional activator